MTYTVRYKIYPLEGDAEMPDCYVNAYYTVTGKLPAGCGPEMIIKAWKEVTGSTLKLTYNQTVFKVTFASEADAMWFKLRWS
jgi:hypothetical protein